MAINKPCGLLVHRSPIDRRETRFALQLLRDQLGQKVYPVHRLDKPTSGVLLFALDRSTARMMEPLFADQAVRKTYLAVVRGQPPEAGTIEHALKEKYDAADPSRARQHKPAQPALTQFRRLSQVEWPWPVDRYPAARYCLLECRPQTGRRHQLRRHLKHINHPLTGDTTYGKGPHNRLFREQLGIDRLLLHAATLEFEHPVSGQTIALRAPTDAAFDKLAALGLTAS